MSSNDAIKGGFSPPNGGPKLGYLFGNPLSGGPKLLQTHDCPVGWLVGWLEFNVPFQHKHGYIAYIRYKRSGWRVILITQ